MNGKKIKVRREARQLVIYPMYLRNINHASRITITHRYNGEYRYIYVQVPRFLIIDCHETQMSVLTSLWIIFVIVSPMTTGFVLQF